MNFETVIGLEVHIELATKTKIFCGCKNEFGGEPNTHCCPVCIGMPGVLPVLNEKVVEFAAKAGLALDCKIANFSKMDRKGYYYPDLPKAYQISQFDLPICIGGHVDYKDGDIEKRVNITRIHMEEDAGKLLHEAGTGTAVDYNRCGVPLIEIVTEPDLRSADEAKAFLETLKSIIQYTGVSDCKMQEGSLRCDVNVSVREVGSTVLGTRTEMKNLNSFSAVHGAIEAESARQIALITDGGKVTQETRRFDDIKGKSYAMRGKEEAHDYRYFPDPDLVPITITDEQIALYRDSLPELPTAKKQRFIDELGLPEYDADLLTGERAIADFFEASIAAYNEPKKTSNFIMTDLLRLLKENGVEPDDNPVQPIQLAQTLKLIDDGKINVTVGKTVFEDVFKTGDDPSSIVEAKGLTQINDTVELSGMIKQIIADNPKPVADFKGGNKKALTFFVGQVMKATKGKANPKVVNEIVQEELKNA
ncbi:MAG: Asp-tRNA(Asn)/Glu-tRNA(Gln) amidotransferase subunit GatB [Clostridia bacterium]|jgi:aspartyl-tRNA(Asn)/glutamyl-tRNA(Gln) amidotransferase subunit B|nr:Asp-tRNA(Asn)/Glu-tRNA(Gln) amidotransferase subunit GatB [Clostridia bacterium]MBT7122636.1 Asp-tRNA(Asn)/Glu-tRNA(Gln) amidotransferase subunit GatB [Clostridia bacterium]